MGGVKVVWLWVVWVVWIWVVWVVYVYMCRRAGERSKVRVVIMKTGVN